MKRTALAGLIVCASLLASPVFAAEDLCQINLQKIDDTMATLVATSENTDTNLKDEIQKAKAEQAAGKTEDCIATTTQVLQRLQDLTKGGEGK